jgi:hypothetical protein
VRVSAIRIQKWDGELTTGQDQEEKAFDRVTTMNGDTLFGDILGIEKGELQFSNELAEFKVPLDRIQDVRFNPETRATPRLMEGDVKLKTAAGEVTTLQLLHLKEGMITGTSETTGELKLRLRYFAEMQFNPYDERHQQDDFLW